MSAEKALRQRGMEADSWHLASSATTGRLEGIHTVDGPRLLYFMNASIVFQKIGGESSFKKFKT